MSGKFQLEPDILSITREELDSLKKKSDDAKLALADYIYVRQMIESGRVVVKDISSDKTRAGIMP